MSNIELNNTLFIKNKNYIVSDLIDILIKLPANKICEFFNSINLNIPRKLRIDVLKEVLENPRQELLKTRQTTSDELYYRLLWFHRFSESQLIMLLNKISSRKLNELYIKKIWFKLLDYIIIKKVDTDIFSNYILEAKKYDNIEKDINSYNQNLNQIFYDNDSEIDGLNQDEFRPVLYKSATIPMIKEIGLKYGVNVPRRLKKAELISIIFNELDKKNKLNEEIKENLAKQNLVKIQRFAKDNNIKASVELKKEEMIEYILANAKQTKKSYYIPSTKDIYNQEAQEEILEELKSLDELELFNLENIELNEKDLVEIKLDKEPKLYDNLITSTSNLNKIDNISYNSNDEFKDLKQTTNLEPFILNTAKIVTTDKYLKEDSKTLNRVYKQSFINFKKEKPSNKQTMLNFLLWINLFLFISLITLIILILTKVIK